ncbi:MAG: hypothetical protein RBT63_07460 [Bdellovibrionales bacterium]|nr:hypothetical protein [Bdellovibrionales bacterium]
MEIILALSLASIAILGAGVAFDIVTKSVRHSQLVTGAIIIESQILSTVSDPTFMSLHREALSSATNSGRIENLEITYAGVVIAKVGQTIQLDRNARPCASPNCQLEVLIDTLCTGTGPDRQCFAAYRISSIDTDIPMSAFGSPEASLRPEDFRTPIAFDRYLRSETSACPPGHFMTGLVRTTGEAICSPMAASGCASNEIFQGYEVRPDGVSPICMADRSASCPYPYVLTNAVLGDGASSCVFVTVNSGPMANPWVVAESASVKACPHAYYDTVPNGSCTVVDIVSVDGVCGTTCTTNAEGVEVCVPNTVAPPPPTTISSVNNGVLNCQVVPSVGPCGGHATGKAFWGATCVLKVPPTIGPTIGG